MFPLRLLNWKRVFKFTTNIVRAYFCGQNMTSLPINMCTVSELPPSFGPRKLHEKWSQIHVQELNQSAVLQRKDQTHHEEKQSKKA